MALVEERVTNLEEVFARFLETSERIYIQNDIRMRKFDSEMKQLKIDHDTKMEQLQTEMKQQQTNHDAKMEQLRIAHDTKMQQQQTNHDTKMEQLQTKFDTEMKQLRINHDAEMKEIKKDSEKKYQDLIHKLGTFLEDIVAPNIPKIAKDVFQAGDSTFFAIRAKVKKANGETREFDALYISETTFLVNESKSNPKIDYIDNFIEAIENIYDYFPLYKDKILVPVFSSFHIPENVKKYLTKNKIYGMQIKDDTMEIINFDELNIKKLN